MKNIYPTKTKENVVLVRDEARYTVVNSAIRRLCDLLTNDSYCSVSIRPNEESETSMTVEFVTDCINLSVDAFSTTLALAETVNVSPRTDGYISIKLLFDGLYTPAVKIC